MKKLLSSIEKISYSWIFGIILIYSLVLAEYYYILNLTLIKYQAAQLVGSSLFSLFMSFSFVLTVFSAFVIWIISAFIFYLIIILFGGEIIFKSFQKLSAMCYIFPTISFIIAFVLFNKVKLTSSNINEFLTINKTMIQINWIINLGYISYYLTLISFIEYKTKINWLKSFSVIVIPIGSIYLLGQFFANYVL